MKVLALAVLLTLAPLSIDLPIWVSLSCLGLCAFSLAEYRKGWMLQFLAAVSALGVALQYGTLFSREAGMALLSLLVCLKLVESKGKGDASLVVMLCFFLIMTWFFDSQSVGYAIFMLFMVIFLGSNLIMIHSRGKIEFREGMGLASHLVLQAIPISLVLFLLFPRIPGPIWSLPESRGHASSGLSDRLAMGSISRLVLSDEVAFRVRFFSKMPERTELYWRGPVLWDFDGKTWSSNKPSPGASLHFSGEFVRYEVTIEPSRLKWLFALDMPSSLPPDSSMTPDWQIRAADALNSRIRYAMTSGPDYIAGRDEPEANLQEALRLPMNADPKAKALAASWKGGAEDIASQALAFFKSRHFVYTLAPPRLESDEIDDFLFRTRSGFCEHYASSFAFLMRAAGVPSRIVTGYQGGEYNPIDGDLTVRQSDAHAWVEIWERDKGWVRLDPTAIVAPVRIASGISDALPQTEALPLLMRRDAAWARSLRFGWDAAANVWNQWVVGFGEERQKHFLSSLGLHDADLHEIAMLFSAAIILIFVGMAVWLLFRLNPLPDRVQTIYMRFCDRMKRHGIGRMDNEGPLAYAERIALLDPELAFRARPVFDRYIALRYGKGGTARDISEFARMARSV